jgi:hypothetical protein
MAPDVVNEDRLRSLLEPSLSPCRTVYDTDNPDIEDDISHNPSHTADMTLQFREPTSEGSTTSSALVSKSALISDSAEIQGGFTVEERTFRTTSDFTEWLATLPKTEAYRILNNCHDIAFEQINLVEQILCDLHLWAQQNQVYEGTHNLAEFEAKWASVTKIALKRAKDEKTIQSIQNKAVTNWGTDAQRLFTHLRNKGMFDQVNKMLRQGLTFDQVRNAINNSMVKRLGVSGKGSRSQRRVILGDLEKVTELREFQRPKAKDIRTSNLDLTQDGFCCERGSGITPMDCDDEPASGNPSDTTTADLDRDRVQTISPSPQPPPDTNMPDADNVPALGLPEDIPMEDVLPPTDAPVPEAQPNQTTLPRARRLPTDCMCAIRCASMNRVIQIASKLGTLRACLVLLRSFGKTIYMRGEIDEQRLCQEHALKLFELFQMNSASKSHQQLAHRINFLYQNLDDFDNVLKNKAAWFLPKPKPTDDDQRGFYRWAPEPTVAIPLIADFARCEKEWLHPLEFVRRVLPDLRPAAQKILANRLPQELKENGSIVIPGLFSYLSANWDGQHSGGIIPLIHEEIQMYEYHFRPQPNRPRLGWNRIMWHSLGQQLIRQDLGYYMSYVFFRPDHAYRLVSFPYYCKSTQAGEKTFFRHIDINIDDYIQTGRGRSILQGSVSLTNEDTQNCTEILPKMHNHIGAWWTDVKARRIAAGKEPKNGLVQGIDATMWTADDAQRYQTNWTKQVCQTYRLFLNLSTNYYVLIGMPGRRCSA